MSRKVALATGAVGAVGVALGAEDGGGSAERRVEGCGRIGSRGSCGGSETVVGRTARSVLGAVRSHNLANAVAIAIYEALRRTGQLAGARHEVIQR